MNFRETERAKQISNRDAIFRDGGKGKFQGKTREFVLLDPTLNLFGGIREDAINYFKKNKIQWWESISEPSGHILSSQIACLNHLYFIRQREDLATSVLQEVNSNIKKALKLDSGFVEFEKVGVQKLGLEKSRTRGANSTSIDALMLGETYEGKNILFFIEWKYTESYNINDLSLGKSGSVRFNAYKSFLSSPDCPIDTKYYNSLFFEPFYQLMRQTFLGWQMVSQNEYNAKDWQHIDVVPQKNVEFRKNITSSLLKPLGSTISDVWKKIIFDPSKYIMIEPELFVKPVLSFEDTKSIGEYLKKRYW